MATRSVLLASLLLWTGCIGRTQVIPDHRIPHQIAKDTKTEIWVRREKDPSKWVKQEVTLPAGWWVAGPEVVEGKLP